MVNKGYSNKNYKISSIHNWITVSADLLNPEHQFHLNWSESRSIQLEDIDLPPGNVLVGLSFNVFLSSGINRLILTAYGSVFDLSSRKIHIIKALTYRGENFGFFKTGIDVHEYLLPSKNMNNIVDTDTFVSLDISDLKSDLGQTTIPFFDIQDVTTKTPTIMGGAGLYYKYLNESRRAGYIGLKLKIFDYTVHFSLD